MLLSELEDVRVTGNTGVIKSDVPLNTSKKIAARDNVVLGQGRDAIVYQNSGAKGIGVVTKQVRAGVGIDDNGTIQYLIRGNKLGNPFVPVVYEIKSVSRQGRFDAEVVTDYFIKMEKLHATLIDVDLDIDQSVALMRQVWSFNEDAVWKSNKTVRHLIEAGCNSEQSDQLTVQDNGGNEVELTRTDSCKQVIALLRQVAKDTGDLHDIHSDNIMVRLTQVGMQVVISDPLANGNY